MARDQEAYTNSRRRFCWMLAGALVVPGIAIAQPSKVRRIGVLEPSAADPPEWVLREAEPLRALGWVEGQNLLVERRYANGRIEALQGLAEELVRANVEIIVTANTAATLAAKRATTTIPIVFRSGDPVLIGLVTNLSRPGGNLTGLSLAGPEITAKYLSILKELLPRVQRIGALWDAGNVYSRANRNQFERVCKGLGVVPLIVEISLAGELGEAFQQLVELRAQALVLEGDITWHRRFEIVDAAMKRGLPTMAVDPEIVRESGALIAYSAPWREQFRLRAEYIDRILRGAKPADLPVQQPTKFELVINFKTAKALGVTIPKELLLRADEVIQ